MINNTLPASSMEVGVVGLGLMGSSIIVSLLISGHNVKAIAPLPSDMRIGESRIQDQLDICKKSGFTDKEFELQDGTLEITEDYGVLKNCKIVFECVIEDVEIKSQVYKRITDQVASDTIVATNTSAIAITTLQHLIVHPERFLGVHWAEPAYATRFMEITCGEQTNLDYAEWIFEVAHNWGKEPTLLRKDIQGFITNRLMYAVYREIFHLIEKGATTMEDVDKAFRYDVGSWITLMGVFRRMDLTGLNDWAAIFENVFPTLSNTTKVPKIMQQIVEVNARGIQNLNGLYSYSPQEAKEWETAFAEFNKNIFQLASCYPFRRITLEKDLI